MCQCGFRNILLFTKPVFEGEPLEPTGKLQMQNNASCRNRSARRLQIASANLDANRLTFAKHLTFKRLFAYRTYWHSPRLAPSHEEKTVL